MLATCQCGSLSLPIPSSLRPLGLYICHCLSCRKQSSSAFGITVAYPLFPSPASSSSGVFASKEELDAFVKRCGQWTRPTDSGSTLLCLFCRTCGSRLAHLPPNGKTISIKGGCLDELGNKELGLDLKGATHIWCARAVWEVPEGVERWDGEPPE